MTVQISPEMTPRPRPVLREVGGAHAAWDRQHAFADDRETLLRRAQANGQRLVAALYLILDRHTATSVVDDAGRVHLRCAECRSDGRTPEAQFPCPTAQDAYWALDAVLR